MHTLGANLLCASVVGHSFLGTVYSAHGSSFSFSFYKAHIQCNALMSKEQNLLESLRCRYCLTCLVSLSLSLLCGLMLIEPTMETSLYLNTIVQNKAIEVDCSDQIQIGQYKFVWCQRSCKWPIWLHCLFYKCSQPTLCFPMVSATISVLLWHHQWNEIMSELCQFQFVLEFHTTFIVPTGFTTLW